MPIATASALAGRILDTLRAAGHTAYLAGGCVRDLLLGRPARDFDVATAARPEELLRLFPGSGVVGAHFGVVLVRDGEAAVEVATFRSDHAYRDGRRPEGVTFETDPRRDALRRDFTINALMMEPRSGAVLDFVGGRADLAARIVRAVGDPCERFAEDHLRLLRAVRFAARLGFEIEPETMAAIRALAPRVRLVAAERVRVELVRILCEGGGARRGVELLRDAGLLAEILPEVAVDATMLAMLGRIEDGENEAFAMAALLRGVSAAAAVLERLRCSRETTEAVVSMLGAQGRFADVARMGVAELKRFLRQPGFPDWLRFQQWWGVGAAGAEFAAARLAEYSRGDLFPPRLATGDDLMAMGLPPGPAYARLLESLETEQLEGRISSREEALAFLLSRLP